MTRKDPPEKIEFRRRQDGLTYVFKRETAPDGILRYRRVDLDLFCEWNDRYGWIVTPADADTVLSIPWEISLNDQSRDQPPEGVWVSRKGDKSYVYDLVYSET